MVEVCSEDVEITVYVTFAVGHDICDTIDTLDTMEDITEF